VLAEALEHLVRGVVDHPDDVTVRDKQTRRGPLLEVRVNPDDLGKVIEEIGMYHPKEDPSYIDVVSDRAAYWLGVGAQPTDAVVKILTITGDWQKFKGYSGTEGTLKVAPPKPDKLAIFNEALKEAANEPKGAAVTRKSSRKKAEGKPAEDKPAETPQAADAAPAEAPAADAAPAEAPAADAAPAEADG
jgi:small subunit ribosomal protein S16